MDEIEANIVLPRGARPFASYARYYATESADHIIGEYMLPALDDPPSGTGCADMKLDGRAQDVPCSLPSKEGKEIGANERVWLRDGAHLPMGYDQKCGSLTFVFNTARHRIEAVSCVGINSDIGPHRDGVRWLERPRALAAALRSGKPMPLVVILDDGSLPEFALYADGTAFQRRGNGLVTSKLSALQLAQFMRKTQLSTLRPFHGEFDVSSTSDQQTTTLLSFAAAHPVAISVYGSLEDPLIRQNLPPRVVRTFDAMKHFDLPKAERWSGAHLPHSELWE